jgi:phosphoenolpyruvate carboxylase
MAMTSSYEASGDEKPPVTLASLESVLAKLRERAEADPSSNPIVLFAIDLMRRIDSGEITFSDLDQIVQAATVEAFRNRAERLGTYLGDADPDTVLAAITARLQGRADGGDFTHFREAVERPMAGIVLTAHPTFAMPLPVARALTELACGRTADNTVIDQAALESRLALAQNELHRPPERLTLEVEHAWSLEALANAHEAINALHRVVFAIARAKWPDRWTELAPRVISLSSWVGYDQDGRTDVTSMRSFAVRLADKLAALVRYRSTVEEISAVGPPKLARALEPAAAMLAKAAATVELQARLLAEADDPRKMADFSRAMVAGRLDALVDTAPLFTVLDEAIEHADNDSRKVDLLLLRATLKSHGLGLAQVQVRLNASQLHNAIRQRIGLHSEPNDPSNRRSYFNAINDMLEAVRPATVSFAALMTEEASARRLMMALAQMVKFVDATMPIRFLIAETQAGFTLLTALYYARLFGVERQAELSPLFETEEAFERGERVIEEALKSSHYRDYLKRTGRLAVQFGYSDSGRFLGQMAATFHIERLRLRLAQLLERYGLQELELILFNTHGESIGRGGHPATLDDRLSYVAPDVSRAEFVKRGIRVTEEISFQGGDGFLPFLTPASALAVVARMVDFFFATEVGGGADPIYAAPDYAAEFFATVKQEFADLVRDPDYAELLGLYGTNMLYRTGSRPPARESEESTQPTVIKHPAELRAIPNNAILQQIGFLANTLYGLGRAAAKDPEMFEVMCARSRRFGQALSLVSAALELSDLDVMRAYVHVFDPGLWLTHSGRARAATRVKALRELARLTERLNHYDGVARIIRRLQADHLLLLEHLRQPQSDRRRRLILLHGLRIALIMRIAVLSTATPPFSPQRGVTRDEILSRILRLEVPVAVERLMLIFPLHGPEMFDADFGEESSYRPDSEPSYAVEHRMIFAPVMRLYELVRLIGSAISHEIGAMG